MRRTILSVFACLALVCLGALASASESKSTPMAGSWQCMAHGGSQGDVAFTMDLEQNGEAVSGSVSSSQGDADITSATFKNNTLEIKIDTQDSEYVLRAAYGDGKLTGTWSSSGTGTKGTWEGKKAQPSNP